MNHRVHLVCLLVFVLVLGAADLFAAEPLNRIVAIVNNDVITLHELNLKFKEVTGVPPEKFKEQNDQAFLDARQQVLELLIDEKITEAKVRELKINVTQKQVEEAIERIKKENKITQEDLLESLKRDGIPYDKFQERVRKDLERVSLINTEVRSKIIITDERAKRYYEEHRDQFRKDGKVNLAGIFLVQKGSGQEEEIRQKGREILQSLRSGADFGELAKKHSDGPGAENGGDLGAFRISQLDPEMQKVIKAVPAGGVSELIIRQNGVQIIKVLSREGGEEKGLEEVKEAVYSAIYQEEVNERYASWIKQLRDRSYTRIIF
jgi:peptidyl-prolyl cis-trans isomerase SurA